MKRNRFWLSTAPLAMSAFLFLGTSVLHAATSTMPSVDVFVTNRISRVITNIVEVRMPVNVFFNDYRTNLIERFHTNLVDVYRTNLLQRSMTNLITIERTQTNWVSQYQTNLNAFTITNWQTVVVLKTNWVSQTLTNVVEINLPAQTAAATSASAAEEPMPRRQILGQTQEFQIELERTEKPSHNGQFEVQLALRCTKSPAPEFTVQDWQLIQPDGTVLMFGQRAQFKTELAAGKYKVAVKVRRGEKTPAIPIGGDLLITRDGSIESARSPQVAGLD